MHSLSIMTPFFLHLVYIIHIYPKVFRLPVWGPQTDYQSIFSSQAYKNFGSRVRALKRKLDELLPTLPNGPPSPPARDEDVPSPGPDEDIDLPPPNDNIDGEDDSKYLFY